MRLELRWSDVKELLAGSATRLVGTAPGGRSRRAPRSAGRRRAAGRDPPRSRAPGRAVPHRPRLRRDRAAGPAGRRGLPRRAGCGGQSRRRPDAGAGRRGRRDDRPADGQHRDTGGDRHGRAHRRHVAVRRHAQPRDLGVGVAGHRALGLSGRHPAGRAQGGGAPGAGGARGRARSGRGVRAAALAARARRARASAARGLRLPDPLAPAADRPRRGHPVRRSGAAHAADDRPSQRSARRRGAARLHGAQRHHVGDPESSGDP